MHDASSISGVLLLIIVIAIATLLPSVGLWAQWRKHRTLRRRRLFEDALKHIMTWEHRSQVATPESLAGALGLSLPRQPTTAVSPSVLLSHRTITCAMKYAPW